MPLIENSHNPLARSILIPVGFTAGSTTDAAIHKKLFGSGSLTLTVSNEEMNIMKIVKYLKESGLLIKGVKETIKNEANKQKGGFLGMILGT